MRKSLKTRTYAFLLHDLLINFCKKARGASATGFTQKRHTLYAYYSRGKSEFQMIFLIRCRFLFHIISRRLLRCDAAQQCFLDHVHLLRPSHQPIVFAPSLRRLQRDDFCPKRHFLHDLFFTQRTIIGRSLMHDGKACHDIDLDRFYEEFHKALRPVHGIRHGIRWAELTHFQ